METIDERLTGMLESFLFIAGDDGLTLSQIASLLQVETDAAAEIAEGLRVNYENRPESGITLTALRRSLSACDKSGVCR